MPSSTMSDTDDNADFETITQKLAKSGAVLNDYEERWRDRQQFLQSHGYMLRPRYHPEWVPSWHTNGRNPTQCEDYARLPYRPNLTDATRIADRRRVYIKRVATGGDELTIARYFSEEPLRHDSANHCVPIMESFQDDLDPAISYIVMPFLRLMNQPDFSHINDVVDFVDQTMEGLVFMHNHGVAHRDCTTKNLMMDGDTLFPRGFHPVHTNYLEDTNTRAPVVSRLAAWPPVKYYYVDFGIAVQIPPHVYPKLALGEDGLDREVPELSNVRPYDPFKVDIFILGNVYRKNIYAKFSNVNFLHPLITDMTQRDPNDRPDADRALLQWKSIRSRVGILRRGNRLRHFGEGTGEALVFDVIAFLKLGIILSRRFLIWTARWLSLLQGCM